MADSRVAAASLRSSEAVAKSPAVAHIGERLVQSALRAAERTGGDVEAAAVEPGHCDLETDTLGAESVHGRHTHVLEYHRAGRLRVPAHFAFVGAKRQPRTVAGDEKRGNPGRPFAAAARHDEIEVARAGAGNELLLAIEDVVLAVTRGARRQSRR